MISQNIGVLGLLIVAETESVIYVAMIMPVG